MLALPTSGLRRSVAKHNSDLKIAADWLELIAALSEGPWSQADVLDVLLEGGIYENQTFAAEFVQSMFAEVRRRYKQLGSGYPIVLGNSGELERVPRIPFPSGVIFCLLLSLGPHYSDWSKQFAGNYTEQGDLFEFLMVSALKFWFPSWTVVRTGWGDGTRTSLEKFVELVSRTASEEIIVGWAEWVAREGKDLGLDIAVVRPFGEESGGVPLMMWQCASGQNWKTKLKTPDTKSWHRVMTLTHTPLRGLGTPDVIPSEDVKSRRNQHQGVLLDRYRLLPPSPEREWLDPSTALNLRTWCEARLDWLRGKYPLNE
jgi:hypothetical protein